MYDTLGHFVLQDAQNDKVKFFNNLYYQQGLTLEPNFVNMAKDVFKSSEPQSVDLNAQQFVQEFNQITNDKTEGFINNLLKDGKYLYLLQYRNSRIRIGK